MSRVHYGQIENGRIPKLTILEINRVAAVLGLAPSLRVYPSGAALRTFQKVQGATSRAILSTNPLYIPQQVASQAAIGIPATRGRLLSGKGNRWYRGLDDRAKEAVDEWTGMSPARDMSRGVRYGAALATDEPGAGADAVTV